MRQNFFGKLALKALSRLEEEPRHDQGSPPQFQSGIGGLSVVDANHIKIPSQPSLDTGLGAPRRLWSGPVDPGTVTGGWPLPSQHTTGTWMGLGKSKMETAPEKPVRCQPAAPRSAGLAPPPTRPSPCGPSPRSPASRPAPLPPAPPLPLRLLLPPRPSFCGPSSPPSPCAPPPSLPLLHSRAPPAPAQLSLPCPFPVALVLTSQPRARACCPLPLMERLVFLKQAVAKACLSAGSGKVHICLALLVSKTISPKML